MRKRSSGTPLPHHIGMYYYCRYWRTWDKLLAIDKHTSFVTVVKCDLNGQPIEEPREHCTAMELCYFANKPFNVTYKDL